MGLSSEGAQTAVADHGSLGLPCTEIKSLVDRVALAVLCDTDRAAKVSDELLAGFRSLPAGVGPVDETARIFIARAAYDAAMAASDPGVLAGDATSAGASDDQRLALLASLPPRSRAVVVLRDVEGFELAQIVRIVRGGEGELATELFRARRTLASSLAPT